MIVKLMKKKFSLNIAFEDQAQKFQIALKKTK